MKFLCRILGWLALWGNLVGDPFDHEHTQLTRVLKLHVRDGLVDYQKLKADPSVLKSYLNQVASVPETEFKKWTERQQLAWLLNVYNAVTLQLIIDHYPVKSIKDIGGFLSGPWKQPVVQIWGQTLTLDHLEHQIIRKRYREPRSHFAMVCAAKSCPPLRSEAYRANDLYQQLTDQGRVFLRSPAKNRWDPDSKILYLSPIFDWFNDDFVAPGRSLTEYLRPMLPIYIISELPPQGVKVKWTSYDWSLNERSSSK